jgi:hypothetical protein
MTYAATAAWLRPRLWLGWATAVVVWLVWLGSLAIGGWSRDAEGMLLCGDHIAFYTAARLIGDGRPGEIYNPEAVGEVQQEITSGTWPYFMAYRNPPFYALLYTPTARLPFPASALLWTAVGLGAFAFAIWCLRPASPWRVIGWSLAFYPFFTTVQFGQNTLLSLAIFAAVYRLLIGERLFAAGLVAGLLWYKPQLLLGLMVWWGLAPRRYGWCWAGLGATGLGLAAISWSVIPEASRAFVETLEKNIAYGGENGWNKHSPRAFWALLLPGAGALVLWGLTLASAAAGLVAAVWVGRRAGMSVNVMYPVAIFLTLWVSPHTLIYEWALLIPAAVVLWEQFPDRRDAWLPIFALGWIGLTVSTLVALVQIRDIQPLLRDSFEFEGLPTLQVSIPVLGLVGWAVARVLARAER